MSIQGSMVAHSKEQPSLQHAKHAPLTFLWLALVGAVVGVIVWSASDRPIESWTTEASGIVGSSYDVARLSYPVTMGTMFSR